MIEDPSCDALFADDAPELLSKRGLNNEVSHSVLGVGDLEEIGKFAARLADGHQGRGTSAPLGFINGVAEFARKLAVPETSFVGGDLHSNGQKALVVAVEVGLHQGLKLVRAGHQTRCGLNAVTTVGRQRSRAAWEVVTVADGREP